MFSLRSAIAVVAIGLSVLGSTQLAEALHQGGGGARVPVVHAASVGHAGYAFQPLRPAVVAPRAVAPRRSHFAGHTAPRARFAGRHGRTVITGFGAGGSGNCVVAANACANGLVTPCLPEVAGCPTQTTCPVPAPCPQVAAPCPTPTAYPAQVIIANGGGCAGPAITRGSVQIRLPDAQAAVWCNGQILSDTGLVRNITTQPLQAGTDYSFDVKAAWHEGGQLVSQQQTINISAGGTAIVYFGR
jgi:uncharacterized protein (TIGR03000 family)